MEKGQVLKAQPFERYFMVPLETVDAMAIDTLDEYQLIVQIGNETHRVNFSLGGGVMRSKEILSKEETTMKPCKTHRGIKIFKVREEVPGSSLRELKSGDLVSCKPKFYPATFQYAGSFPYDTLTECIEAIDWIYNRCKGVGGETDVKKFASILNGE